MIRVIATDTLDADRATAPWSTRSTRLPLSSELQSADRKSEQDGSLEWLSLSTIADEAIDIDREICRLALIKIDRSDDEPPLANDRWM
jgi:hypothetical protein